MHSIRRNLLSLKMCEAVNILNISEIEFIEDIYLKRLPVVIRGLNIGACCEKWTPEYLSKNLGENNVKVHVTTEPRMNFISKNFLYRTLPSSEFIRRASEEIHDEFFFDEREKFYLRSLGDDPRKEKANIENQFPQLSPDVKIPQLFSPDKFFSSVLRIGSSGVHVWTHYDVMDNILMQIRGTKRVVLFSPADTLNMYLIGDKSEVIDIDNPDTTIYPDFLKARRYEVLLEPGDVLFIPALWFHNTMAIDFNVNVNVFWKHLSNDFYDDKDVYGNKDLIPATQALNLVDKATKLLEHLPSEYKDFYAKRLIRQIQNKIMSPSMK